MKKLLLISALLSFSFAGITSFNGLGFSPAKVYNTEATSVSYILRTGYSRIELDATSATLNYELTANYAVTASRILNPVDGQMLMFIVINRNNPITVTTSTSVVPAPTSNVYTFATTGNNVLLIYSKRSQKWHELSRKGI